ncbi:uncharacterized protein LOC111008504 [Momordica charantia]|uniref:Uncharacterized protein LOC111008504 n=1 Tax=Momordica charantia TaxID=3673 RepID=A0A6J1C5A8_MOMCH|nr:uncharacterized protein LOC111008504 [Momordica charantia]
MAEATGRDSISSFPAMAVNQCQVAAVSNGVHVQEKLAKVNRLDEAERHCSLEILPILFEKASFPFQSSSVRDSSGSNEEFDNSPDCDPHLAFLSILEVTHPTKSRMSLETSDTRLTCQNVIDIHVNGGDAYSSCIVNIDIDKDKLKTSKPCDGIFESLKTDNTLVRIEKVLQRQSSLKLGVKLVQYLLDHGLMLLKFSTKEKLGTERVHDMPNNRWRKYKRAASFDSRKIVILFSVLSSLGTLILIYLTLRVRQQGGDGSVVAM